MPSDSSMQPHVPCSAPLALHTSPSHRHPSPSALLRLDEGAAGAVQEAVERATRALADQIAADVVTAELESEQWTALGRRLGALEASLREVPGEIGESIRAELRRGAEAAMGAREGDGVRGWGTRPAGVGGVMKAHGPFVYPWRCRFN